MPQGAEKKNINPIPNITKVHVLNCSVRVEIYLKMVNDSPEQNQKASLSSILVLSILGRLIPEELKGVPVHVPTGHSVRS